MNQFKCCFYCVPPKRHPGCHAECAEYIKSRAEFDRMREIEKGERRKDDELRSYDVDRNERARKKKKKRPK